MGPDDVNVDTSAVELLASSVISVVNGAVVGTSVELVDGSTSVALFVVGELAEVEYVEVLEVEEVVELAVLVDMVVEVVVGEVVVLV